MVFPAAVHVYFFEAPALFRTKDLLDIQVLIHLQYFHLCPQGGDFFYLVVDFFAVRLLLVHESLQAYASDADICFFLGFLFGRFAVDGLDLILLLGAQFEGFE